MLKTFLDELRRLKTPQDPYISRGGPSAQEFHWKWTGSLPSGGVYGITLTCRSPLRDPYVGAVLTRMHEGEPVTEWRFDSNRTAEKVTHEKKRQNGFLGFFKAPKVEPKTAGIVPDDVLQLRRFLRDFLGRKEHLCIEEAKECPPFFIEGQPVSFKLQTEKPEKQQLTENSGTLEEVARMQVLTWLCSIQRPSRINQKRAFI